MPLILFKTASEFQQQNVIPGAAQEGVGAFAEPSRDRIVMPLDEPPDLLYRLAHAARTSARRISFGSSGFRLPTIS